MAKRNLQWKKTVTVSLAAAMVLANGSWGNMTVSAEEETTLADLQELTAPELQTEEGSAAYARLKIGDWLDYGDYELERTDVPGTAYFFYITTKDEQENVINDTKLAYCIQSYFLTPLPGDHSDEMTDHITQVGDGKTLNRILYYGYDGPAYDQAEFEEFLKQENAEYFETVYANLEEHEQEEVSYVLTHCAASYAYFTDATSFEEYLNLQFEIKYGETWEKEYGYFKKQELEKAGIEDGDMDLLGATYGMNETGIALAKAWYDVLSVKQDPGLEVICEDDVYTFYGNEKNEELAMKFAVPEDFVCTVLRGDGSESQTAGGETVTVYPGEQFVFAFVGEQVSAEEGGITELTVDVTGALNGAEDEVWNLVLLETNKGNTESVTKRQQDIAGISMIDAGKTELSFEIELEKGAVTLTLADEEGQPVAGAVFGVYYDETCEQPVSQEDEPVQITTDENGETYLEFVLNETLLEQDGQLYLKQLETPTGYTEEENVYVIGAGEKAEIINGRETVSVGGSVDWNVPDETLIPEELTVSLLQNGEVIDTQTISAEDDWTYEWDGLLKYSKDEAGNTEEALYEIAAEPIEGFELEMDGYDLKSTITGTVGMEGQMTWEDEGDTDQLRPEAITVELYRDGEDESIASVQISEENDWKYQFEDLEQYSEDGLEAYSYYIGITAPEGYEVTLEDGQIVAVHEVIETEPETETELVTEAATETELVTEAATETALVTEAATENELVTEAVTETELVTEEATETELVTEEATENELATEAETETAEASDTSTDTEEKSSIAIPIGIGLIILLILFLFERARRKASK